MLLLEGIGFLQHFLNDSLQLTIMSAKIILWGVIDNDLRLQKGVLAIVATHIDTPHLWDTEGDTVDECLPPYAGSRTCYRRSDELANLQVLIFTRESAGITIVILTDQDTRRTNPLG